MVFKATVVLSRKWDASEAGEEIGKQINEVIKDKPSFVLLFSTIHYEKYGGFKKFLDAVNTNLPSGTPILGGTVAGFINKYGAYTRGATALAVYSNEMDIAIGVGHDTKKNPNKAAETCARMIKKGLATSRYRNKLLFEIVSGGRIPPFPGMGRRRVVTSGLVSKIATALTDFSLNVLQYGVGREEEVLSSLSNQLPDYTILGGSSMDNNTMLENYQFFGNDFYKNSIVAVGISTDQEINLNTTYGFKETGIKIKITKKRWNIIHEIDGLPALDAFLKLISWPYDFIDERIYRKTFSIPLGYRKDNILFPNVIGGFLGKDILCGYKIESNELDLLSASGKSLVNAVDENLKEFENKNNKIAIIVECGIRLEAIGANIFITRDKLLNFFGETPFILIYTAGEDAYSLKKGKRHVNGSFNVVTISNPD